MQGWPKVLRSELMVLGASLVFAIPVGEADDAIDYLRDVRPILSANCFTCHGPDEQHREADLRLDREQGIDRVVVAGDVAASEMMARIATDDEALIMPPVDSGKELTPDQIEILRRWVEQGGDWQDHWAFVAPVRPAVPLVNATEWVRNPIDAFVLARLEAEGIEPSPEADATTLLRRMSLDLVGLPPTIDEADSLLIAVEFESALAAASERMLASPHFGEKWGRMWLDAARYADSDGFEKDKPRRVFFYRDYVIDAFNDDLPYNQFLIEQIAGDLLPNATQDQIVATGFLRNSMLNEEGGIDPEQFRMEAMFDRMDAIGKAMLGVTVQCAQCHTHKYDPLTQSEYYQMFACINNTHEACINVYTDDEQVSRDELLASITQIETRLQSETPDWRERMRVWEAETLAAEPEWTVLELEHQGDNSQRYYYLEDGSVLAQGYAPTRFESVFTAETDLPEIRQVRIELLNHHDLPAGGPGRSIDGLCALTEFRVEVAGHETPDERAPVTFNQVSADFGNERLQLDALFADKEGNRRWTGPIEYAVDGDQETAWGVDGGPGRRNDPHQATFATPENIAVESGTRLTFHLEQKHGGWNSDDNQNMNLGRFRISVSSAPPADITTDGDATIAIGTLVPANVLSILSVPESERTTTEQATVFSYWRTTVSEWRVANDEIESLWAQHPSGSTQLAMLERSDSRATHRLNRGDFLKPEEEVVPGTPGFLHALDADDSDLPPRLSFAHWLADERSPTTARSIVNRIWQGYFGIGFVSTTEDFGFQGELPSHPELLDWLACELMENNWSLKHIHRLIVDSATYRQSSRVSEELFSRDPDNRLLARGPRFRIDAELVRNVALAASGLLNHEVGGPSVYPPAPEFLFSPPVSYGPKTWERQSGPDIYRRAIYTFRFRSVPYPMLAAFDAPNGDFACVRRSRSNTPLQSLVTLNEPLFVECANALARRTLDEAGDSTTARIEYAFRCCLTRFPTQAEVEVLSEFLSAAEEEFSTDTEAAISFVGDEHAQHATEMAAWSALARVILNLEAVTTKE